MLTARPITPSFTGDVVSLGDHRRPKSPPVRKKTQWFPRPVLGQPLESWEAGVVALALQAGSPATCSIAGHQYQVPMGLPRRSAVAGPYALADSHALRRTELRSSQN